jgi:DNA-binding XRE family transcriptional regulator
MPAAPDNYDAHDYGGVSREYIGKIERGVANPSLPMTAQISHVVTAVIEGLHFQSRTSGMSWPFWSM